MSPKKASTKQATKPTARHKRNTDGLKRGGPGRPKGVPNKATVEMKEFARGVMLDNPKYVRSLTKRLLAGRAPHMETLLAHYGYGKPKEEKGVPPLTLDPATLAKLSTADLEKGLEHAMFVQELITKAQS